MKQVIKKLRKLPTQGGIQVALGDRVSPDTAVGKLDYIPGQLYRVNVAHELGLPPSEMPAYMSKEPGEWIEAGEVLAASDEFFIPRQAISPKAGYVGLVSRLLGNVFIREPLPAGPKEPVVIRAEEAGLSLVQFATNIAVDEGKVVEKGRLLAHGGFGSKKQILSPVFGKVSSIVFNEGTITIKPLFHPTEIYAHIQGVVTAIEPGESVEISTYGHLIQGVVGFGGEQVGHLQMVSGGRVSDLTVNDLPEAVGGKVLVHRGGIALETLNRLAELGTVGLVLGSASFNVLKEFLKVDPLQTTGASADTPFTIILINGFGNLPMADEVYAELAEMDGQVASIDGSTQLRAGVVRPEVVVALPGATDLSAAPEEIVDTLAAGARVMVVREPGFGVVGQVRSVSHTPQPVGSGALAATAVIVDEVTGREWLVPQTNAKVLRGVAE